MRAGALLAVVGCVAVVTAAQAQRAGTPPQPQQQQTFRGGTRTVPVFATVSDGSGGFVLDLSRDDFEIRDNGALQEITQFTTDVLPVSAVVLLDGSASMLPSFDAVVEAANSFIIRMLPDDRVRIGSFADIVQMSPAFTSNRDTLLDYLRNQFNLRMGSETRLWDAMHQSVVILGETLGRRVVLVFTDGYDTASDATAGAVLADARRRDAVIYAIAMWTGRGTQQTRPSRGLESLATDTGGGYYEISEADEMNSTFTKIATELHQEYVMGFSPKTLDGKVHRLEVTLKKSRSKAAMRVQARRSYLADPDAR